jgi:SmpA / OmlA family
MKSLLALMLAVLLSGCAGSNFVRPNAATLGLGSTTYDQVIATYGKPHDATTLVVNGNALRSISYGYSEAVPYTTRFVTKSMKLIFREDVLVSYDFASSVEADHGGVSTKLDDDLLAKVKKGDSKSTVVALLGYPGGEAMPPVAKDALEWRYTHLETWRIPFVPRPRIVSKVFTVSFDSDGKVLRTATVERKPE